MLSKKLLLGMGGSGEKEETDPYFRDVSLLLHGDGSEGANNNVFVDSGPNNHAITRYGNVTQGTFGPFSKEPGKWGVEFNGSSDFLTVPASDAFNFGTGDFVVEAWIFRNGAGAGAYVYESVIGGNTSTNSYWNLYVNSSNNNIIWFGNDGVIRSTTISISNSTWTHVAVSRSGTTLKIFINGIEGYSATVTTSYSIGSSGARIGFDGPNGTPTSNRYFNGTISNLRIVKGTALYTSNFTPPRGPLTAVPGTSLLCCQDNRFKDNSSGNLTLTPNGNVAVTPFSPFANSAAYSPAVNGGSGYFDGNGDRLFIPANSNLDLAGDFTFEFWAYPTLLSSYRTIWDTSNNGTAGSTMTEIWFIGGSVAYYCRGSILLTGAGVQLNQWQHVAVTKSGSTQRLFLNGTQVASATSATQPGFGYPWSIGDRPASSGSGQYPYVGYLSDVRVTKGVALYTANFTPPTVPLIPFENTALHLNFKNAGIIDHAGRNNIETVGDARVSTSVKKYGTGAMYFDGSGDYLTVPSNASFAFGTGDFTIEFWLNPAGVTSGQILFDERTAVGQIVPSILIESGTIKYFVVANRISVSFSTINSWSHIALCRSSGSTRLFINGIQGGSTFTDSNNYVQGPVYIGARWDNSAPFKGYIDDFRITKGVARYTANFTPPPRAFPNK